MVTAQYIHRALIYDNAPPFHQLLIEDFVKIVKPQDGEKLLDLACGTGLLAFALYSQARLSYIHGIDNCPNLLNAARLRLQLPSQAVLFEQHDIASLDTLWSLKGPKESFDIITICNALMLLPSPLEHLKSWIPYLEDSTDRVWNGESWTQLKTNKPPGRLILSVPHPSSMIGLSIFEKLAPKFGIPFLGSRAWIGINEEQAKVNLERLMLEAGLKRVQIFVSRIYPDMLGSTPLGDDGELIEKEDEVEGRIGYREWMGTIEVGEQIFDFMTQHEDMAQWREDEQGVETKRERWAKEWVERGVVFGATELVVYEEERVIFGIGYKE